jgi:hypothetical protein
MRSMNVARLRSSFERVRDGVMPKDDNEDDEEDDEKEEEKVAEADGSSMPDLVFPIGLGLPVPPPGSPVDYSGMPDLGFPRDKEEASKGTIRRMHGVPNSPSTDWGSGESAESELSVESEESEMKELGKSVKVVCWEEDLVLADEDSVLVSPLTVEGEDAVKEKPRSVGDCEIEIIAKQAVSREGGEGKCCVVA